MITAVPLSLGLFAAMVASMEIGFRKGRAKSSRYPEWSHAGLVAVETAVFGLFGLLLAFSFAGATTRLDARRLLIVDEVNAISDAYETIVMLPSVAQPDLRRLFRHYLDARIKTFELWSNIAASDSAFDRAERLEDTIWVRAVAASALDSTHTAAQIVLPALLRMTDVTTAQRIAARTHLPELIAALLISFALVTGILAGYSMAKRPHRSWLHTLLYAICVAGTIYAVWDMDEPRSGLIRLRTADQALIQLRNSIR